MAAAAAAMTTKFKPMDMKNFVWLFIVRRWITMWEIYCGDAFLRCRLLCECLCVCVYIILCERAKWQESCDEWERERERTRTEASERKRKSKDIFTAETWSQWLEWRNREVGGGAAQRPIISISRMFVKPKPPNWNYTNTRKHIWASECVCVCW